MRALGPSGGNQGAAMVDGGSKALTVPGRLQAPESNDPSGENAAGVVRDWLWLSCLLIGVLTDRHRDRVAATRAVAGVDRRRWAFGTVRERVHAGLAQGG